MQLEHFLFYVLFSVLTSLLTGCQHTDEYQTPVPVIFDTDMGSDCDDVGALALLHHYMDAGKAEIIACLYSSGKVPYGAAVIEMINREYGRPLIPVGALHDTTFGDPVDKMTTEKFARDTSGYGHSIVHNFDAKELTSLARKVLAGAPDQSVVYLTVGHTRGLYELMVSEPDSVSNLSGYDLIKKKVSRWVALGGLGALNDGGGYGRDWNFFFNGSAPYTDTLVDNFPGPIYFVLAGNDVMTGKGLKALPAGHLARTLYRDWLWNVFRNTLDDQRPSWDLAATYYAIEGPGNFLNEADQGYLDVDPKFGCKWIFGENQQLQHHLILEKEGITGRFEDYLNDILATGN